MVGDFNCVFDSYTDIQGHGQGRSTWPSRELRRLVRHFGLEDAWTLLHGATFQATWSNGTTSCRLDRMYVSRQLATAVTSCTAVAFPQTPVFASDHNPVIVDLHFVLPGVPGLGRGVWMYGSFVTTPPGARCPIL